MFNASASAIVASNFLIMLVTIAYEMHGGILSDSQRAQLDAAAT
jgi:hypothetical protein